MRLKEDPQIRDLIENEWAQMFDEECDDIRLVAKENIVEIQKENIKTFNKKRKKALKYTDGDLVAIKRIQFPGLKFRNKFIVPYRVTKVMHNNRYTVAK